MYPLAVRVANQSETVHLMILMLRTGEAGRFFVLSRDRRDGASRYTLRRWRAEGAEVIDAGSVASDVATSAVTDGVPIPQDEYMFGWRDGDALSALVVVYTTYSPALPEPSWAVMPLTDSSEEQWPPFTGDRFLGHWFWERYWAGDVVSVGDLIASTSDTVFWVDTQAILGSNCCVVTRDVSSPQEPVLRRGRYVYHEVLRRGTLVPTLDALLADRHKTDLAPVFEP